MFIGHWAPALAAAAATPKAPKLGALFVAAQLVDFAFFILVIGGVEQMRVTPGITVMNDLDLYHMPYTHSLLGSAVWGLVFGWLIYAVTKERTAGIIAGLVVVSHWVLDFLVHTKDLTLLGSPPKLGLGLWNYPWIEIPLELGITAIALFWYRRSTRGPIAPISVLAAFLLLIQSYSWISPPPEAANLQLYITALVAFGATCLIAWWVGRTRIHNGPQD